MCISVYLCVLVHVFNKRSAFDKDPKISAVRLPPLPGTNCDPISCRQSLFTASDRVNLFLHQGWGKLGGGGHHHSCFRAVQPAHVQYILGAKAIDLLSSATRANTYKHTLLPLTYGLKCITGADPVCQHSYTAGATYSQPFSFSK